ncbi:MAG: sulfatase [Planctomycetes bacterium]|nr:sulfatase [Planctomycetota bacterium]
MHHKRTLRISLAFVLALLSIHSTALAMPAPSQPNVILIYADDLGYGDLACYGSTINATPHIDKLAAQGMRFTQYYSASSVCSPSRGALLTGCYPPRIGFDVFNKGRAWVLFPGYAEGFRPDEMIMPEVFKARGYATAHVGKWHCGDQPEHLPTRHGFDSYYGLPYSNDMAIMPRRAKSVPLPLLRNEEVIQVQPRQAPLIERYTEESVRFIRDNQNKPFFLYLAHMHVHLPHYVMPHFESQSKNGRYGAAVAAIDWSTGVLMNELEQLGLTDNTIVIFTSDNGSRERGEGGDNGALRGHKGQVWEGGMRVPCIVHWPGKIKAGAVSRELVTALDFYPTLASIAGYKVPAQPARDGVDISDIWLGKPGAKSPRETFFYYSVDKLQAARMGDWKLHLGLTKQRIDPKKHQLYNLADDLGETTDVAKAHPDIVQQILNRMQVMREDIGDKILNIKGRNERAPAVSENPKPLVEFDPNYPYIEPSYLLNEAG